MTTENEKTPPHGKGPQKYDTQRMQRVEFTDDYIRDVLKRDPKEYRDELAAQKEEAARRRRNDERLRMAEEEARRAQSGEAQARDARKKLKAIFSDAPTDEHVRVVDLHEMETLKTPVPKELPAHEKLPLWKRLFGIKK